MFLHSVTISRWSAPIETAYPPVTLTDKGPSQAELGQQHTESRSEHEPVNSGKDDQLTILCTTTPDTSSPSDMTTVYYPMVTGLQAQS
jgi:hypothetical protein